MKINKKNGMILGEMIFALILCGVIMAISINMFKSNDVTKSPYLYSVLKNLPNVNKAVMEDSYREGTTRFGGFELPDKTIEYCTRLSENFVVSGEVDCSNTGSSTKTISVKENSTTTKNYGQNFRLTNGVSFYGITKNPDSWSEISSNSKVINKYIDVYIDINGPTSGSGTLGEDIFPIRIFKNGDVVPSFVDTAKFYNDDEFFAYRVLLNRKSDDNNPNVRTVDIVDARSEDEITNNSPFREKVSFREALCISNPSNITRYFPDEDCTGYTLATVCNFSQSAENTNPYKTDTTAYCMVEPVKPKGSGIFRLFGM